MDSRAVLQSLLSGTRLSHPKVKVETSQRRAPQNAAATNSSSGFDFFASGGSRSANDAASRPSGVNQALPKPAGLAAAISKSANLKSAVVTAGNKRSRSNVPQHNPEASAFKQLKSKAPVKRSGEFVDAAEFSDDSADSDDSEASDDSDRLALFAGQAAAGPRSTAPSAGATGTDHSASSSSAPVDDPIRSFRKRMGIKTSGHGVPDSYQSFDHLPSAPPAQGVAGGDTTSKTVDAAAARAARFLHVRSQLLANIEASKFKEPTPIQMQALPCAIGGRDVLGCAPTGSGKTAAFAVPLLVSLQSHRAGGPRALILVPTKELAAQTVREIDRLGKGTGIRAAVLSKGAAASTAHGRISAAVDAGDLARKKRKGHGRKRQRQASSSDDDDSDGGEAHGQRGRGARAADPPSDDDDGDDVLHWTDDEDIEAPSASERPSKPARGSSSAASSSRDAEPSATVPVPLPGCDILVCTPLLLVALLRHSAREKAKDSEAEVTLQPVIPTVRHVVFDEADKLLELGFLEQVDEILSAVSSPRSAPDSSTSADGHRVQLGMFTATLSSSIEELALSVLKDPVKITIGLKGAAAANVEQKLLFVGKEEGKMLALRQMVQSGVKSPVLVFVQSKDRALQVHKQLQLENVTVEVIHSDRSEDERADAVKKFRRGEVSFLVATDLLGRGLDFLGVSTVINFDFPQTGVSYIHRIGRTGRAGRKGTAVTLFTEDDIVYLRTIANVMRISGCDVPDWMLSIKKLSRRDQKKMSKSAPRRHGVGPKGLGRKSGPR